MNSKINQDATVPFWFHDLFQSSSAVVIGLLLASLLNWLFSNDGRRDSFLLLLEKWLRVKWKAVTVAIIMVIITTFIRSNSSTLDSPMFVLQVLLVACIYIYKSCAAVPVEMLRLQEDRIGRSFAWWYYVNYLLIALPDLHARVDDLEYKYLNIKIPVKKLFILIPRSGKISSLLNEVDKYVDKCKYDDLELADHKFKERSIINTVYRILPEAERDTEYLCIVEYCTPVYTLHEMNRDGRISDKLLEGTVNVFYTTLCDILGKCHHCQSSYELILYDDIENFSTHKISREIRSVILKQNEGISLFRKTKIV